MKLKYVWSNQTATQSARHFQNISKMMLGPNNKKNTCDNNKHNRPLKKIKRFRSAFTTYQINYLEAEFKKFPYIGTVQRKEVAAVLKIPERAVKIWFQNRRMKEKKEMHLKETEDGKTCQKVLEFSEEELHPTGSFHSTVGLQIDALSVMINNTDENKNVNYDVQHLKKEENVKLIPVAGKSCEFFGNNRFSVPKDTLTPALLLPQNNQCHKVPSTQHLFGSRNCNKININEDNAKQSPTQIKKHELSSINRFNENNDYDVTADLFVKKQKVAAQKYQMECSEDHNSPTKKMKRYRSAFTTDQTSYLEKEFKKIHYIGNIQRKEIADALKLPESAVKIWFQNRRMKEKKESCFKEHEEHANRKMMEFPKKQLTELNDMQAINGKTSCSTALCDVQAINEKESCSIPLLETYVNKLIRLNVNSKVSNEEINIVKMKESVKTNSEENIYKTHTTYPLPVENDKVPSNFNNLSITSCKTKEKIDITRKKLSLIKDRHSKCYQDAPQDLSLKQQKSTQTQKTEPKVIQTTSNLCPNTYIPHSGILWKPLNIVPIVSAASSLSLPVNNSSNLLMTEEQYSQKVKCNCDCHMKMFSVPMVLQQNSTNPHFIITALPVSSNSQNPSFNVNI